MKSLKHYLEKGEDFLRRKGIEKPRLEAQILFSHFFEYERYQLYTNDQRPLEPEEVEKLRELLVKKSEGIPTAYITGKKEFFRRDFIVNADVLIPRPETEELIELVLKENNLNNKTLLDIGCGSGCIGLTLAIEKKPELVMLTDISEEALVVAKKNYEKLSDEIESEIVFFESDLFSNIGEGYYESFDCIVSNPPYITPEEFENLMPQVKNFEPVKALLVEDVTGFFSKFFEQAILYLKPQAKLYLETNPAIIDLQRRLAAESGFAQITTHYDLSRKQRFFACKKP